MFRFPMICLGGLSDAPPPRPVPSGELIQFLVIKSIPFIVNLP
jgi:hypothetical protein